MTLKAEAQPAESRGQQLAMEKAGEIAQEVVNDTKKVYQAMAG